MQSIRLSFLRPALAAVLAGAVAMAHAADVALPSGWPPTVVKLEDLSPLAPFVLKVPGLVVKGAVVGPAVVAAHVSAEGTVERTALLDSCGNPDLDEAAMRAVRVMKFKPPTFAGQPAAVTLALPVHVPKRYGRSD